eukprot:4738948-Pyramimonas_sp.AAC.1
MASATYIQISKVAREKVHEAQQGFIPGQHFLSKIVHLDAAARQASVNPEVGTDLPAFAAHHAEAAFSSLGRYWLFEILSGFGFPP